MTKTMNLTINNSEYTNVPVDLAKAIETMLAGYKAKAKAKTTEKAPSQTKSAPKETKSEPKREYAKAYAVADDGKSITVGGEGFVPSKVFKAICYSLKLAGAKYDAKTKAWAFDTKKACTTWVKAQEARA